jgi:hypothetical protein
MHVYDRWPTASEVPSVAAADCALWKTDNVGGDKTLSNLSGIELRAYFDESCICQRPLRAGDVILTTGRGGKRGGNNPAWDVMEVLSTVDGRAGFNFYNCKFPALLATRPIIKRGCECGV